MKTKIVYYNQVNSDLEGLVGKLDDWYFEKYGEIALNYRAYNALDDIKDVFITYDEENPIACVCFKEADIQTAEVKRMYVLPEFRRLGIAEALLNELVKKAKSKDYKYLVLQTGCEMNDAIDFYKEFGFEIIPNYNQYEKDEICLCMKLKI